MYVFFFRRIRLRGGYSVVGLTDKKTTKNKQKKKKATMARSFECLSASTGMGGGEGGGKKHHLFVFFFSF